MSNAPKIIAPEDTVTQMAHRAYDEYVRQHRDALDMRFPKWDKLLIAVKSNWKQIVGKSLGMHGTIININPMNREPYTIVLCGLTKDQMLTMAKQLNDKMGGANMPQPQETVDEPAAEPS